MSSRRRRSSRSTIPIARRPCAATTPSAIGRRSWMRWRRFGRSRHPARGRLAPSAGTAPFADACPPDRLPAAALSTDAGSWPRPARRRRRAAGRGAGLWAAAADASPPRRRRRRRQPRRRPARPRAGCRLLSPAALRSVGNDDAGRLYAAQSSPPASPPPAPTGGSCCRRRGSPSSRRSSPAPSAPILPQPDLTAEATAFVRDVAADLDAHKTRALVLAGPALPPDIHALCAWINAQLRAPLDLYDADDMAEAGLAELTDDLRAGKGGALFILGCNPAYDASPEIGFEQAVAKAKLRVHLGLYDDETSRLCEWRIAGKPTRWKAGPTASRPDGSASLAQPLIAPLFDTRSAHQILAALDGDPKATDHDLVRQTWRARAPDGDFESFWRKSLHDGVCAQPAQTKIEGADAPAPGDCAARRPRGPVARAAARPLPVGRRFANNAWLQECPKPLTKQVWGNALGAFNPRDARNWARAPAMSSLFAAGGRQFEAPVMVEPGVARGVVSLALGHRPPQGRRDRHRHRRQRLSRCAPPPSLAIRMSRSQKPAAAGDSHHPECRSHRGGCPRTLSAARSRRGGQTGPPAPEPEKPSLLPERPKPDDGHAWAMVIDAAVCIGCNACVVACQAENNVAVVGPEEVARGRDMHWLRVDVYDHGSMANPRLGFPAGALHALRACALRTGLPGGGLGA